MKKILIVEDEEELASNIAEILSGLDYQVAGIVDNAISALEFLEGNLVDLVLMDILIKGDVDGIDLAYKIREKYDLPIVFSTAYSGTEFLERISSDIHEGYLLKPFTLDSLKTAVFFGLKRYQERLPRPEKSRGSLKVMDKGFLVPIPFNEILYLKADGLYTKVFSKVKSYLVRDILKSFEDKLPEEQFLRVHKSFLINVNHVSSFNAKKINLGEVAIPIRRGLYKELIEKLHVE
ncbi:LytTR family DNA-binding domain-containing protein [Algoriphagus sp. AK58]|uniref:LytR/AlgR family response regulator transcription factor n=1 Tax=Algoriphagus sp. AK58 TaxID=1406877 RepID=UPI00164FB72C|nr:response regulator [Algoriphagus sp. AK58]MBC6365942.1 DNA-binding response regulator [Algoriphagus sp. AK58]